MIDAAIALSFGVGVGTIIVLQLAIVGGIALWCRRYLYDFLTLQRPVDASILIIEGWVPDRVMKQIATVIEQGHYVHVVISGLPLHQGSFLSQYKTHGEVTADSLVQLGIPRDRLTVINCPHTQHYRTRAAAQAIHDWLKNQPWAIAQVNLCTVGAHGRRSWLIYHRIFAPRTTVGVISLRDGAYDPAAWWRSSAGVRALIGEAIAYLYVRWLE